MALRIIGESALDRWSHAVGGAVDDELITYFRQRVGAFLDLIERGAVVELSGSASAPPVEASHRGVLLLDESGFRLIRGELSKAFQVTIDESGLAPAQKRAIQSEIEFLLQLLDESIAVSLVSALFRKAEKLQHEKQAITRTLSDTTHLIEREQQRLAFDLHDGPAQALSSALLQTDILEDMAGSTEAKRELESLKSILSQCLHELRTSIYALKPQSMLEKGLVAKLKGYARQFSARTGINVAFLIESEERDVDEVVAINVFRVIQEALTNAHKHAEAKNVIVNISFGESGLVCKVVDDGIGFDPKRRSVQAQSICGYGLASMRDRVEQFSGTFTVDSAVGRGTCVSFSIPL